MGQTSTSWKTGQSGNPNGRPLKGASITELMREYLNLEAGDGVTHKEIFIRRVFDIAMKRGDVAIIKLIWSYMDGQPKQFINIDNSQTDILETKRWIDKELGKVDKEVEKCE